MYIAAFTQTRLPIVAMVYSFPDSYPADKCADDHGLSYIKQLELHSDSDDLLSIDSHASDKTHP